MARNDAILRKRAKREEEWAKYGIHIEGSKAPYTIHTPHGDIKTPNLSVIELVINTMKSYYE